MKECIVCGKSFVPHGSQKTCSKECSKTRKEITNSRCTRKRKKSSQADMLYKVNAVARERGLSYGMYVAETEALH